MVAPSPKRCCDQVFQRNSTFTERFNVSMGKADALADDDFHETLLRSYDLYRVIEFLSGLEIQMHLPP